MFKFHRLTEDNKPDPNRAVLILGTDGYIYSASRLPEQEKDHHGELHDVYYILDSRSGAKFDWEILGWCSYATRFEFSEMEEMLED